jgi:O-antigen/teichoic acid export membrane protein
VLEILGVDDFGLYNVVGGIVSIFTFFNSSLATGTQRFLSYALGEGSLTKQKNVFSSSLMLHFFFAAILVLVAELIGLFFLYNKMNIPAGRIDAAFWVFQFSIAATVAGVVQTPFKASLIAHENMGIYAYVSIYESLMKLLVVFSLCHTTYDRLVFYAFLIMVVHISSIVFNVIYCKIKYSECEFSFSKDKKLFKEISFFSSWNIFGCAAVGLQGQGINVLLNMFFGTMVNAARGIAFQVNGIVMQFVNNFQIAVNPQIVKLYASGNSRDMTNLVVNSSKFAGFLYLLIAIPCFVEIDYVLKIWLVNVPDNTGIFLRIILAQSLIQTLGRPVVMAIHAVGCMKMPNLTAGGVLLLILPISYILLRIGCSPTMIFVVNVIPWFLETVFESFWLRRYTGFSMLDFFKKTYGKVVPLGAVMLIVPLFVHHLIVEECFYRLLAVGTSSVFSSVILVYFFGIDTSLRKKVDGKIQSNFFRGRK